MKVKFFNKSMADQTICGVTVGSLKTSDVVEVDADDLAATLSGNRNITVSYVEETPGVSTGGAKKKTSARSTDNE